MQSLSSSWMERVSEDPRFTLHLNMTASSQPSLTIRPDQFLAARQIGETARHLAGRHHALVRLALNGGALNEHRRGRAPSGPGRSWCRCHGPSCRAPDLIMSPVLAPVSSCSSARRRTARWSHMLSAPAFSSRVHGEERCGSCALGTRQIQLGGHENIVHRRFDIAISLVCGGTGLSFVIRNRYCAHRDTLRTIGQGRRQVARPSPKPPAATTGTCTASRT